MKHWCRVLILFCACILTTTILVACGSKINASKLDDQQDPVIDNDNVDTTPSTDTKNPTNPSLPDEPTDTPHEHHYGDWVVIAEPTCTATGLERQICDGCDDYKERTVDTKGHAFTTITVEPTCVEDGYTVRACQNCEYREEPTNIPATREHKYVTDGHKHICQYDCGTSYFDAPPEDFAGTYWFIEAGDTSLLIYFDAIDEATGFGNFVTYYGTFATDGTFIPKNNGNAYAGTYYALPSKIRLTNTNTSNGGLTTETTLSFQVGQDDNGNPLYTLQSESPLFSFVYGKCTLTFAGYEIQYGDEY